jgi:xylan 1,4-beta-xylosidase
MSYWTFSDVFDEQGVIQRPYYGGFGLVAERGIPKAAFRAFELLHSLGNQRIESDAGSEANDALITKKPDGTLAIALWNYAGPDEAGKDKTIQLRLKSARDARYTLRFVRPGSGSSLEEWIRLGKPDSPTQEQIARLVASSRIAPATNHRV